MDQHPHQGGWKKQQHVDAANLVSQFIHDEISVTMRKRLEMETMSYQPDEQQLSQLSLPFDFKIECNQYHMSPKSQTVRDNRKMHNHH